MTARTFPTLIAQVGRAAAGEPAPSSGVGVDLQPDLHERHEAWLREQYLRDHDALDRWEGRIQEQAGRCDG